MTPGHTGSEGSGSRTRQPEEAGGRSNSRSSPGRPPGGSLDQGTWPHQQGQKSGCVEEMWLPHVPFSFCASPGGMMVGIFGLINENESLCWTQNQRLKILWYVVHPQERQKKKDVYKLISADNSFLSHSIIHKSTFSGASRLVSEKAKEKCLEDFRLKHKSLWEQNKQTNKKLQKRQNLRGNATFHITFQKGLPCLAWLVLTEITIKPSNL